MFSYFWQNFESECYTIIEGTSFNGLVHNVPIERSIVCGKRLEKVWSLELQADSP